MSRFSEQASRAIRSMGGRMTAQRQLVIDLLENNNGECDAETLYHLAHAEDNSLSIATVYRTLSILETARLVQLRYRSREHDRRYYELISTEPTYHFTCRICHKVLPFHSELVHELEQRLATELDLVVLDACVCLDGLCQDCREKAKSDISA